MRARRAAAGALVAALAGVVTGGGCAIGPDYRRPDPPKEETFRSQPPPPEKASLGDLPWWDVFGDPVLQQLLREAVKQNLDVVQATARVDEARAINRGYWWKLFPSVSAELDATRRKLLIIPPFKRTFSLYTAEAKVAWELDVWGTFRRAYEASSAQYRATEEARRGVINALVAEVAETYFNLRSIDSQLGIVHRQREVRLSSLRIFDARLQGGTGNLAEVANAKALVFGAEATQAELEQQRAQAENALSVLLGHPPAEIPRGLPVDEQVLPEVAPAGLPSSLLERRPDIREAEQQLVAANATVGATLGLLLPAFNLSGLIGSQSPQFDSPLEGGPVWTLGANITWTLPFLGGEDLRANHQASHSRFDQALANWRQTVLTAMREVSDALVARDQQAKGVALLQQQVDAVKQQLELAQLRYEGGTANYLEVTIAAENLLPILLTLAQSRANQLTATVQLYRALGGGWQPPGSAVPGSEAPASIQAPPPHSPPHY